MTEDFFHLVSHPLCSYTLGLYSINSFLQYRTPTLTLSEALHPLPASSLLPSVSASIPPQETTLEMEGGARIETSECARQLQTRTAAPPHEEEQQNAPKPKRLS